MTPRWQLVDDRSTMELKIIDHETRVPVLGWFGKTTPKVVASLSHEVVARNPGAVVVWMDQAGFRPVFG